MKNFFFYITFLTCLSLTIAKPKVVLFGVDGLLQRCIDFRSLPTFNRILENSSYTFKARTTIQTISAPAWSNILTGLESEASGILTNDWKVVEKGPISPIFDVIPTIFSILKDAQPDLKTGMRYAWPWFSEMGNLRYPNTLDFEFNCPAEGLEEVVECEETRMFDDFRTMIENDVDLIFNYIDSVDETGHTFNFCSEEYIERVRVVDGQLGRLLEIMEEHGVLEETVVIVTTDHGATYLTDDHGGQNDDNLLVPWMIMGPGIRKNYEIKSYVKSMDTAATILEVFGEKLNEELRARPVFEAFMRNLKKK